MHERRNHHTHIGESIINKNADLTQENHIRLRASTISEKFTTLNTLYSAVSPTFLTQDPLRKTTSTLLTGTWDVPGHSTAQNFIGYALIVQELCESRGGRPGLSVLTSLLVSVDVKNY